MTVPLIFQRIFGLLDQKIKIKKDFEKGAIVPGDKGLSYENSKKRTESKD